VSPNGTGKVPALSPDRETHELILMVCTVIARQLGGVERIARLAAGVGATWEDIGVDPSH
jgi:hypothetical protein